jgi:hypothetical protein
VAHFGTSCFELPWAALSVQHTVGYPLVVISGVPVSILTFCYFPRGALHRGWRLLLTRTTTGYTLVPQMLRRRKWSRPLFVAWPCHSRSTSPQPPKCVSLFRKLSAQSSRYDPRCAAPPGGYVNWSEAPPNLKVPSSLSKSTGCVSPRCRQ